MSLEKMRKKYESWQGRCKERNCRLKTDRKNCMVINAEEHRHDERESMCDCIVFADYGKFVVGVCELKSGRVDVSQVKKQLEAGIRLAERMCKDCSGTTKPVILPILLTKSISGEARMALSVTEVEICKKTRVIIREKCGIHMSEIIRKYS